MPTKFTVTNIISFFQWCKLSLKGRMGASLVAQWLWIRLPMQGTWVRALVGEDPSCRGATKPVHHNYWACALEPTSHNYWSHVPQLLKPVCLEPMLCNEMPRQWEACAPQQRAAPACRQREKARAQQRPNTAKNKNKWVNKLKKKKKKKEGW